MSQAAIAGPSFKASKGPTTTGCPASLNSGSQPPCTIAVHPAKVIMFPPESLITLDRNKHSIVATNRPRPRSCATSMTDTIKMAPEMGALSLAAVFDEVARVRSGRDARVLGHDSRNPLKQGIFSHLSRVTLHPYPPEKLLCSGYARRYLSTDGAVATAARLVRDARRRVALVLPKAQQRRSAGLASAARTDAHGQPGAPVTLLLKADAEARVGRRTR